MKLIKTLGILIYTLVFIIIGVSLIALSLEFFSVDDVSNLLGYVKEDPNLKSALGAIGGVIILIGFLKAHVKLAKLQTNKTIAFENPEGQVTISLSAIEDFIKKSVRSFPEVRELRSIVSASKKGINITCKATLSANSNIPQTTEKIQNMIKTKVHDMLGVEEKINIKVNITKISSKGKSETPDIPEEPEEISRRMPFAAGE